MRILLLQGKKAKRLASCRVMWPMYLRYVSSFRYIEFFGMCFTASRAPPPPHTKMQGVYVLLGLHNCIFHTCVTTVRLENSSRGSRSKGKYRKSSPSVLEPPKATRCVCTRLECKGQFILHNRDVFRGSVGNKKGAQNVKIKLILVPSKSNS